MIEVQLAAVLQALLIAIGSFLWGVHVGKKLGNNWSIYNVIGNILIVFGWALNMIVIIVWG